MSENNVEPQIENNEQDTEPKQKRRRTNKQLSDLAKDAESILKGFDSEMTPEGRRTTRSAIRGPVTPSNITPVKKEKKAVASSGGKRGRPKKGSTEKPTENDTDHNETKPENDGDAENDDRQEELQDNDVPENDLGTSNGNISESGEKVEKVGVKENNKEASASTKEDVQEGGEKSTVEATAVEKPEDASN